jgi:hypothetical protein
MAPGSRLRHAFRPLGENRMHEPTDQAQAGAASHSTHNPYAPPSAHIAETGFGAAAAHAPFYVVSAGKAALLMFATFGFYALYWFWRHWKMHKIDKRLDIWPVPRAIFSIFFAHSLNREIDHRIQHEGRRHAWSPGGWATLYVVAALVSRLIDRLPETVISLNASIGLLILLLAAVTLPIFHAQRAANIACGDPDAEANRRLTVANYIWLGLGTLWWGLIALGMLLPEEAVQ